MPEAPALVLALLVLAGTLAAAVVHSRWPVEALAAAGGAALLVAVGALSVSDARHAIGDLGPTVGFLAALLVLAEGCRREGLFDAMGGLMAAGARGSPRRLLALVFAVAATVTAVLSLDATVVLLTPIVFATAARLRTSPRPHVYACSHLANSASLLLPVSNLTNLLAFHASGLSFMRFAGLMALPTGAAVAVEWVVLTRFFAVDLDRPRRARTGGGERPALPRFALAVVALTLAGFGLSSVVGVAPAWVAVAGAAAITAPALVRRTTTARTLALAAEPSFLVFVLGLGVIVRAASDNGLADAAARPAALRRRPARAAGRRRRERHPRQPRQQPPRHADPGARGGAVRGRGGARGARRRQRGPEPDLCRLARDAAVAPRPARRGPRGRARRVRPSRRAHGAGGPRGWRPCSYGSARRA